MLEGTSFMSAICVKFLMVLVYIKLAVFLSVLKLSARLLVRMRFGQK